MTQIPDHAAPQRYDTATAGQLEPKVKAGATAGAGSAAVLTPFFVWLADELIWNGADLPPEVPLPVIGAIGLVVTGLSTLTAGYLARHVDRVA